MASWPRYISLFASFFEAVGMRGLSGPRPVKGFPWEG
jgi:hypothetical protein